MTKARLTIGSRGSQLAFWQARWMKAQLTGLDPQIEVMEGEAADAEQLGIELARCLRGRGAERLLAELTAQGQSAS